MDFRLKCHCVSKCLVTNMYTAINPITIARCIYHPGDVDVTVHTKIRKRDRTPRATVTWTCFSKFYVTIIFTRQYYTICIIHSLSITLTPSITMLNHKPTIANRLHFPDCFYSSHNCGVRHPCSQRTSRRHPSCQNESAINFS